MIFADLFFVFVFFVLCLAAYFIVPGIKGKNVVLVVFSLLFYAWGQPKLVLLLVGSVLVNYLLALQIDKRRGTKWCKGSLIIALVYDIGMLGVFKYTDFMINNINGLFGTSIPLQNIALPLGISFYTFQIISYVIDVYWEKVEVQRNFGKLLMYISLFPQLVAGPIVRYSTIASEIDDRRTTVEDAFEGFKRLIIGLTKKVVLANTLNLVVGECFGKEIAKASVAGTWIGVIAYSMFIYFDFSGYSDMAIGMGRLFGFHFDENFRYPFICRTIGEFWQRWHISLGSFFRDYLLPVPIFGKRRATLSLFLVWFTTGLWHGASWNYVLWGVYFGLFLYIETKIGKKKLKKIPDVIMHIYNKLVIIVGFGIFRFTDFGELGQFFKNLVGANGNAFIDESTVGALSDYLFIIIAATLACFPIAQAVKKMFEKTSPAVQSAALVCLTAFLIVALFTDTVILVKSFSSNNPFVYWQF